MNVTDTKFWRIMHSHFCDAVAEQAPENSSAIWTLAGGVSLDALLGSMDRGFIRVRCTVEGDDVPCATIEVMADAGWTFLVGVPAVSLGIDPEQVRREWDETIERDLAELLGDAK